MAYEFSAHVLPCRVYTNLEPDGIVIGYQVRITYRDDNGPIDPRNPNIAGWSVLCNIDYAPEHEYEARKRRELWLAFNRELQERQSAANHP